MKYEVAAIDLQEDLVALAALALLDLVVDRELGDFFNRQLSRSADAAPRSGDFNRGRG